MITITKTESHFVFEVNGMHKLWAFKSQLTIPKEHIMKAYHDPEIMSKGAGWRAPGTSIPFVLTAGTYYKDGTKVFWDVAHAARSIVIELKDENYNQLIIEVENIDEAIKLLTS